MAFGDEDPYLRSIIADVRKIKPLGDFVLVQPFTLDQQLAMEARQIAPSPIHMTQDGRYRSDRPRGLRYGTVVAAGPGDAMLLLRCKSCMTEQYRVERGQESRKWRCNKCGKYEFDVALSTRTDRVMIERAPMHCALGDTVIFPRIPANEIQINGHDYIWCHEEQHILGVVEFPEAEAEIKERIGMNIHVQSQQTIEVMA
jgi:ribosomal protein L37AE/L43A